MDLRDYSNKTCAQNFFVIWCQFSIIISLAFPFQKKNRWCYYKPRKSQPVDSSIGKFPAKQLPWYKFSCSQAVLVTHVVCMVKTHTYKQLIPERAGTLHTAMYNANGSFWLFQVLFQGVGTCGYEWQNNSNKSKKKSSRTPFHYWKRHGGSYQKSTSISRVQVTCTQKQHQKAPYRRSKRKKGSFSPDDDTKSRTP